MVDWNLFFSTQFRCSNPNAIGFLFQPQTPSTINPVLVTLACPSTRPVTMLSLLVFHLPFMKSKLAQQFSQDR